MADIGKWIFFTGLAILIIGGLIWLGSRTGIPFGKLPGDLHWKGEKTSVYFPIVTSIVVSIILTILLNFIFWLFRK